MKRPNGYSRSYWFHMSRSQRKYWKVQTLVGLAKDFDLYLSLRQCVEALNRKNKFLQDSLWRDTGLKGVT